MKLGVTANYVWQGPPITSIARHVEALGFESLWMGEHPAIPVAALSAERYGVPLPPNYRNMPDLFVSLAAAATATTTLRFGTNVCVVPQHEPILLAKQVATLDRIAQGRLTFGFGTGWIEEEAALFGYRFDKRLGITLDTIRALKVLWTEERAAYSGEFVSFPEIFCNPKPVQKPHVPILVGSGNDKTDNTAILRRVARMADGWLPSFLSPAQMKAQLGQLREFCEEEGREFTALDITLLVPAISFGVGPLPEWGAGAYDDIAPRPVADLLAEYEDAGVTRIAVGLPDLEDEGAFALLDEVARGMGLT